MKNLCKYILVLVLIVLLNLSGCKDNLTKAPLDSPSDVTFFSNQSDLELAINGAYTSLWWEIMEGIPTLQVIDNGTDIGFLRQDEHGTQSVARGNHTPDTAVFLRTWRHFYSGISKVNNLLNNMDKAQEVVSEDFFTRIQAEARFLRAFYYHYLTELFGDVPLLLEVPGVEESQIGRSPKSDVVNQIISDLDFAAENLPVTWGSSDEGRATRGAALALKARVALYNEMYSEAIQASQAVMNLGVYSLYPDYEQQFQYEGIRSSEVIFDTPFAEGVQTSFYPQRAGGRMVGSWSTNVPSQALIDTYQASDGLPIDQSPLYDPAKPFENRDPRLDATILRPQNVFKGFIFETHPDSTETWNIETNARVTNQEVTNPFATFTGYLWGKYLAEEDFPEKQRNSTINWIYIRYAEVLLIYAEAKIESGDIDQSVLDAINKIRARAYGVELSETSQYPAISATDQAELRRILRYERKVELANEGFRLFDIRRWGIADQVMNGTLIGRPLDGYETVSSPPNINSDIGYHPDYGEFQHLYRNVEQRSFNTNRDWLWPIPQDEMNVNENMTQNPGY